MREFFDSRSALAAAYGPDFGTRRKSHPPLPSHDELKASRSEAIRDGCLFVKGKQGMTVFNFRGG